MQDATSDLDLLLFVSGDRPDRFSKAATAGADAVIVDLEDAVQPDAKETAREQLVHGIALLGKAARILIRINGVGTPWHEADVHAAKLLNVAGVVLSKAERAEDVERVARSLGGKGRVVALVESAAGIAAARALASVAGRLAFGSLDFAADIGAAHAREALLGARCELVLASRLARIPGPVDGVTSSTVSKALVQDDAAYARSLGFSGKLLIHPAQIESARLGFMPSRDEVDWAERVASETRAVFTIDGMMVDAPVRMRALQILGRAARSKGACTHSSTDTA
jgi:citrate lyase subunit beta/citryl-CoA lyase